ncbi:MAG: FAD-dependent oxidoreductase [Planctomycetes bacterium]|nr:FAD-dependent oxidoreductase [Planctomycetota bacterium]
MTRSSRNDVTCHDVPRAPLPASASFWRRALPSMLIAMITTVIARPAISSEEFVDADLLVVGGTESGCAAAVQAARMGVRSIVLVNDIEWLGGQFSAESLVAIDENRGPKGYGHGVPFPRAGLFKEIIDRIEAINLRRYGRARPGNTRVITTCRPADAERAFRELLEPYVRAERIRLFAHYAPSDVMREGNAVTAVRFESTRPGRPDLLVRARLTVDASDWGDVIRASGAAYEFGPDLKSKYGEPLAPTSRKNYPVTDMNPITYCMVIVETDRNEPIARPARYDPRNYRSHAYPKDPKFIYTSRRLVDHYGFPEIKHPDVLLLCFPAFDYPLDVLPKHVADALEATETGASRKNIVEMTRRQRQIVFEDAKKYSLGFLHYLQTEVDAAMKDKRYSFRRFELTDEFGTPDRMPPKPYVRESLRLRALYMMRQQDTTGWGGDAKHFATAMYHDGVACWQFEYDFHPTARRFLLDDPAGPWTNAFRKGRTWGPPYAGRCLFPLRSLVPEKTDGLLGAQKNLGYSSIISSAVRLHDQSMAIGQAAGAVAAVCLRHGIQPRDVPFDRSLLSEVWQSLCTRRGGAVPQILWPFGDVDPDHPAFEAINLLAVRGGLPLRPDQVEFRPNQPAAEEWRAAVVRRSLATKVCSEPPEVPTGRLTRGEFARLWWERIRSLPDRPYRRLSPIDADGDGIPDMDDPLPFHPGRSSWPEFTPPADRDGHPDPPPADARNVRQFNFTGPDSPVAEGFINDVGLLFDKKRGFGWLRDISANHRRRNRLDGLWRDTFLFTRRHDRWECVLPKGRYRVTVCIGDAAFPQRGQNVMVEGTTVFRDHHTEAGRFAEKSVAVDVRDGRLTIEIGAPNRSTNTCLNWVRIVPVAD